MKTSNLDLKSLEQIRQKASKQLVEKSNNARIWYMGRPKKQRWVIAIVAALMLIFVGRKVFTPADPIAREVAVEPTPQFSLTVETSGRIQPASEVYVSVKKGGRLDQVLVTIGSPVKKDQLIAVVDETMSRSAIESALANYRLAGAELGRIQSLFRSSAATAQELDQARATLSTKRSELEQARQKLEDGLIRAPIDGNLALLPFKLGETLPDGARVAVIEDRSGYHLRASLPIQWLGRLPAKAEVAFAKYGSGDLNTEVKASLPKLSCDISSPDPEVIAAANEFDVEIKFSQLPSGFVVNDLASVSVAIGDFQDLLRIPASTLTYRDDKPSVLVRNHDGSIEFKSVEVIHGDNSIALIRNTIGDVKVLEAINTKKVQEAVLKKSHPKIAKVENEKTALK